jgi:hypothetical protein
MFRPDDIDYSRLDVSAMLEMRGIAAIDVLREQPCRRWLVQRNYDLTSVDFGRSFKEVLAELGAIFDWRGQFETQPGSNASAFYRKHGFSPLNLEMLRRGVGAGWSEP